MKLQILSDLHIEFGDMELPTTDADVLVFAGDIAEGLQGLQWIESQSIDKPAIYILGNHEFYNNDINLIADVRKKASNNIYVLNNDVVELEGVRFLGCTLWTDFMLFGETDKWFAKQTAYSNMADFRVITRDGEMFTPDDSIRLFEESASWLKEVLSIPFSGQTVVITHHLPSFLSVPERFKSDLLSPAFASHLDNLLSAKRVKLWIHGHTHDSYDYYVNGTRVVCNPRGYVNYENTGNYRADFVVEI